MTKKRKKRHFHHEGAPKRSCPIAQACVERIDYKDIELLKLFITEKGKIVPRRISGLSARAQKKLTLATKRARNIALLSFSEGYMPQDAPMEQETKS